MKYVKRGIYFKKDKKAQIYKKISGEADLAGFKPNDYYVPIAESELWCYTKQLSQEQLYNAHAYWNDEKRLFVFNYRSDIAQYDKLCYNGQWYEITRVDRTDDYLTDVYVYAKDLPRPIKEDQIKPFGWTPDENQ